MAGIIADGWIGQLPLQAQPDTWRAPKDSRYGAVLELPLGEGAQDFLAMYRTTQDGHSTVNGHSGYFPLHYFALRLAFSEKDSSVFDAVTPREEPLLVVLDKQRGRRRPLECTHHERAACRSRGLRRPLGLLQHSPESVRHAVPRPGARHRQRNGQPSLH